MSGEPRSQDFDLQLVNVGERYLANVLRSPAGDAAAEFALPFQTGELDALFRGLGQIRTAPTRGADSPEVRSAQEVGRRLFAAVFSGEVRDVFQRSLGMLAGRGQGLRLRLRLTNVPELLDLPWELLFDVSLGKFLLLERHSALVRYLPVAVPVQPIRVALPLKILVVVSSPVSRAYPALDVAQECARLQEALRPLEARGDVSVRTLAAVTQRSLRQALNDHAPHILHFIGHGSYDREAAAGFLVFEDDQHAPALVSGSRLAQILQAQASLRLVVLNACEGGRTSASDPFAGVAQALVQGALPAVVAMQFPITDAAAVVFAGALYRGVARGDPVDLALAEARHEMNLEGEDGDIEWATPVLYMRGEGDLFELAAPVAGPSAKDTPSDTVVLADIRTRMLVSKSPDALRSLRFEVEAFLRDHPGSVEARELLERLTHAVHSAQPPRIAPAPAASPAADQAVAHTPRAASKRLRSAVLFAAAALVGATLLYAMLPWQGAGFGHRLRSLVMNARGDGATFQDCTVCPPMTAIPSGSFVMGSPAAEAGRGPDEGPQHPVRVARFALSVAEVTFDEWDACTKGGGCGAYWPADQGWGRGQRPVINVSWQDAQAYVDWLKTRTGKPYRLPSEAEWEYAARAGTTTPYWWGPDLGTGHANCDGCGSSWDGKQTAPVRSFPPNAFGLYDMAGNVWQWVADCYHPSYQDAPQDGSAWTTPDDCVYPMRRGGSWDLNPDYVRAAARSFHGKVVRSPSFGFRVARTLP